MASSIPKYFFRDNVYFESHVLESEYEKDFKLVELLKHRQGSTIVYCATANAAEYVHTFLREHGLDSLRFHKRMRANERSVSADSFNSGACGILITDGLIGHEIQNPHVRSIIHFNYPVSLNEYVHETNSAGRDGWPSRCSLLFLRKDRRSQRRDPEDLRAVVKYAQSALCREKLLAPHVSIEIEEDCHRCDNCLKMPKTARVEKRAPVDLDVFLEATH